MEDSEDHERLRHGTLRECATRNCWRMFPAGEGCGAYCSRTCMRADERLRSDPDRLERAIEREQALDSADIFDPKDRSWLLRVMRGETE